MEIGEAGVDFVCGQSTVRYELVFLGVRKIMESNYWHRHACPAVRLSAWNNSAPTGRIFMKFDIWVFFETLSRKFKFH